MWSTNPVKVVKFPLISKVYYYIYYYYIIVSRIAQTSSRQIAGKPFGFEQVVGGGGSGPPLDAGRGFWTPPPQLCGYCPFLSVQMVSKVIIFGFFSTKNPGFSTNSGLVSRPLPVQKNRAK